ncbi:hypothetical protein JCM8208_007799 [Rhodotorula glutinis]
MPGILPAARDPSTSEAFHLGQGEARPSFERSMVWGCLVFELQGFAEAARMEGASRKWLVGGVVVDLFDLELVAAGLAYVLDTARTLRVVLPAFDPLGPLFFVPRAIVEPYIDPNLDIEGVVERAAVSSQGEFFVDSLCPYEELASGVRPDVTRSAFLGEWAAFQGVDLEEALSLAPYGEDQ